MLARAPSDDAAFTPAELWERVRDKRGLESRVPPHAVAEAEERRKAAQARHEEARKKLKDARDARRAGADPEDERLRAGTRTAREEAAKAKAEAAEAERHAQSTVRNRSEPVPSSEHVNTQPLGHGTQTYGAIQVTDKNGRRVALGIASYHGGMHAEEHALLQIRHELATKMIGKRGAPGRDWRVTIVVDQTVCEERCRPALQRFADDYGIDRKNVVAYYPERALQVNPVTPKVASRTSHYRPVALGPPQRILEGKNYQFRLKGKVGHAPPVPPGKASPPVPKKPPPVPPAPKPTVTTKPTAPPTGTVRMDHLTVDYDFKSSSRPNALKLKSINLSDYPLDKPGKITGFFQDRVLLSGLTRVAANMAAGQISAAMLDKVQKHFEVAVDKGTKVFHAQFPGAEKLRAAYDLDALAKGYDEVIEGRAASFKRTAEENFLIASAYEDALLEALRHIDSDALEFDRMTEDLRKRSSLLSRLAYELEQTFIWIHTHVIGAFLPLYYESFTLWNVRGVFFALSHAIDGLVNQIAERDLERRALAKTLNARLETVSEELDKVRPLFVGADR